MKLNAAAMIGLIVGLGGAIIGMIAAFTVDLSTGFIVSAAMLFSYSLVYFIFLKPALEYSRLSKKGISGTGTILSITETSTRINNQPLCRIELKIEIPGKPVYTTTTKTVISYFNVTRYQPGSKVNIKADPDKPEKVIILKDGTPGQEGMISNATSQQVDELKSELEALKKEQESIQQIGIYCKAIVTRYVPSGIHVNGNNPFVTLELQVLPENEPAFPAITKGAIKDTSVPLFQPGEEIFVKYDPNNKSRVVIEHS